MISYRFKRRAFLTAMSGGLGLKVMLRNLEASAQGMKSPARLLVTHWPVGIVSGSGDALFKPTTGSVGGSPGLKPFADAGLGPDMTVFRGISTSNLNVSGGGSHEQGTVSLVTGLSAGGSRASCCEGDDAYAAPGGSFEQILLSKVPTLKQPGTGFANSIADSRTDFAEISTQCLSYSMSSDTVSKYGGGGTGMQALPLKPTLSPMQQYTNLFGSFVPGAGTCTVGPGTGSGGAMGSSGGASGAGGAGGRQGTGGAGGQRVGDEMLKKLACKKSALDFALEELNQMKTMVPASARGKLDIHTTEIMNAEATLIANINAGYPGNGSGTGSGGMSGGGTGGRTGAGGMSGGGSGGSGMSGGGPAIQLSCSTKPAAPPAASGMADPNGNGTGNSYGNDTARTDDTATHQAAGKAHMDVLKAAFVCDLIRVGTFQWSPGTNHVGFKGMYPGNAAAIYQHHPLSHRIGAGETQSGSSPDALNANAAFLYNVQLWYWARHAENLADWKKTVDGCGNSLLDFTAVPFVTEVANTGHGRSNMVGMIIGGKSLGFVHNQYNTGNVSINAFWGTIGQAYGAPGGGVFGTPVAGIWNKPA